jgi:addiction module RelE/StbE family toxin
MKIRWTPLAQQDLDAVYGYIRQEHPKAASRIVERVFKSVEMLSRYHSVGRLGRVLKTRELAIPSTPFIVVYRPTQNEIQILAIIHGARRWPTSFGENDT